MLKSFIQINRRWCDAFSSKFSGLFWPEHTRAWFEEAVKAEIKRLKSYGKPFSILEVGGIDRPFLEKGKGFEYVGMDIERRPQCDEVYDCFFVQSIEEPLEKQYDLILSRMVLEHVPNNTRSWASIHRALKPGGKAIHIFPSGYHPFSLVTRLVGNHWQKRLIRLFRPSAASVTGYPAFYNRCSPHALRHTLRQSGFVEADLRTNYAATGYFKFFFPAYLAIVLFNNLCQRTGISLFCSNIFVAVRRD